MADPATLADVQWGLGLAAGGSALMAFFVTSNLYVLSFIALALIVSVISIRRMMRGAAGLQLKIESAVSKHRVALVRQRRMLVRLDPYGNEILGAWNKEVAHFVESVILPTLTQSEFETAQNTATLNAMLDKLLFDPVAKAVKEKAAGDREFNSSMLPKEFEAHCAMVLSSVGWHATTTKATGDQGADVVAEKEGHRVVLQMKLLSTPVGNKAVQEAHSAKSHYKASAAVVVTNSSFTPSAQQLAQSTGVLLLHHSDLSELEAIVSGNDDAAQELKHQLAVAGFMPLMSR
jgi:restriction system protein